MFLISRAWRSSTPGLPTLLMPMFGIWVLPRKISGSWSVKEIGLARVELGGEPAHEARTIVARAAGGLAELDRVLGLEMAARQIVGRAGKRHEGDLPLGPQRIDAVPQRRMQPPIRVQRQRRIRIAGVGLGNAERRPRTCDRSRSNRHDDVGGIIGAAQEHHQQPRIGGGRGPDAAGDGQRELRRQKP